MISEKDPDQGSLFDQGSLDPHQMHPEQTEVESGEPQPVTADAAEVAKEQVIGEASEGVSINIRDYYVSLQGLLNVAKSRNTNERFLTKTGDAKSPSYFAIQQIMAKKNIDIEVEIGKSEQTRDRLEEAADDHFEEKLFKKDELVKAGLLSEEEAEQRSKRGARIFKSIFFGVANQKALVAETKRVKNRIKELDNA